MQLLNDGGLKSLIGQFHAIIYDELEEVDDIELLLMWLHDFLHVL